jgi:hypothetical protein
LFRRHVLGSRQGLEGYRRENAAAASGVGKEGSNNNDSNKNDEAAGKEILETAVNGCPSTPGRFPTQEKPMEDLARLAAAKQNNAVAVHPGNKCKPGESRKVRLMWDELEERKGKEEEEQAEEKIGEGGGDSIRKTGDDDGIKERLVLINNVDRIYIL